MKYVYSTTTIRQNYSQKRSAHLLSEIRIFKKTKVNDHNAKNRHRLQFKKHTTPNQKELPNGPPKKSTEIVLAYMMESPERVGVLRQAGRLKTN